MNEIPDLELVDHVIEVECGECQYIEDYSYVQSREKI